MTELGRLLDDLVSRIDALEREVATLRERDSGSPFMSVPEAAEFLRTSRRRIDDLLSAGVLGRVKEGRRTLVRRSDVEALVGERR